ncbi:MAG: YbaB/EbfC family nucleoid-associated protein [Bacillota bacterium]|nr:YbaB/EbfC family nucleoid-associated protein [Bacillota bacterium]
MAKGGFPGAKFGGGFPGGGNMNEMIKQAQKMQSEMQKAQEEMEISSYEATVGGGMVTAKVSGKKELLELTISPEAVDPDDVEMLQDMVISAVNEALRKAEQAASESMSKATGGLNIPGLF